jgi:hypothetical protein
MISRTHRGSRRFGGAQRSRGSAQAVGVHGDSGAIAYSERDRLARESACDVLKAK